MAKARSAEAITETIFKLFISRKFYNVTKILVFYNIYYQKRVLLNLFNNIDYL